MKKKKLCAMLVSAAMTAGTLAVLPMTGTVLYADTQFVADDFEVCYDGWTNKGDLTELNACDGEGLDGSRGMKVTNRQCSEDGVYSEKGFYLGGGTNYDYSIAVRNDGTVADTFRLNLRWLYPDGETYESTELVSETLQPGAWTTLAASFTAPDDTVNLTLSLNSDTTVDFSFDHVIVSGKEKIDNTVNAAGTACLKDMYANYFRFGTCMPGHAVNNSKITGIVLREFNSVTCENELKPDATLVQSGSTDTNIKVSLNSAAAILNFCVQNNIAVRGHTFVWHSQTPDWFFKENFNGNWTSTSVMDKRMESYIKNMFSALEKQYPTLNLYAYDVCNECFSEQGTPRSAGSNNSNPGSSAWVQVYGNNSFIEKAFTYAKQYAPEGCSLFYNDYNEYIGAKMNGIYNQVSDLYSKGLIDGVGMQSHLSGTYPDLNTYKAALEKYSSIGCQIQVTELDITDTSASQYKNIVQAILDTDKKHDNVTALVVWGTTDDTSWRSSGNPLLFNAQGGKKDTYEAVASIVPQSDWGDGDNPAGGGGVPPKPIELDKDGYWFHSTFEEDEDGWSNRGENTVSQSKTAAYESSGSLLVSGRKEAWNGAGYTLNPKMIIPGTAYSFSAVVMQNAGASEDLALTLQYTDSAGTDNYVNIAKATAAKGEWTQLANTSFKIPSDASNMLLYVETPENLIDFYLDEAIAAPDGKVIKGPVTVITYKPGDVNHDEKINVTDAKLLQDFLLGESVTIYGDTADLNGDGKITAQDLTLLKRALLSTGGTITTTSTTPTGVTTTSSIGGKTPTEYMEAVRKTVTIQVPSSATANPSKKGTTTHISYYSKFAGRDKGANVYLPAGYSTSKKYPVVYCNHGIMGDESSMLGMSVIEIAANLAASGEAEEAIIVFPQMFTSKTMAQASGINLESAMAYDDFVYDIADSLMPYIESHYSVKTGRENTAICGFSMGGRESLYIGVVRNDLFGYIGCAAPAPGVTPGQDMFMSHPGCMQESELKITGDKPYVLMIAGGTNDSVVGTFPESYHNILTRNGEDHIWMSIPGAGHDNSTVTPLMYNFFRSIFKA